MNHHLVHFFFICAFIVAAFAPAGAAGLLGMSASLIGVTLMAIWLEQARLLDWVADRLIARAELTPYFHLHRYMQRNWLVPYNFQDWRTDRNGTQSCNGTGMVVWHEKPITWLLQKLDIAVRVHTILRSDSASALHDHPWAYVSVVLKRGYFEHTEDGRRTWYGPGSLIFRRATFKHRLELDWDYHHDHGEPFELPATTLFITFRKSKSWGFFEGTKFTPHAEYRGRQ